MSHLHPQRRHVHRLPELRRGLPGLQVAEHDPPQRDLPADVLAAAARAGDARHGRAVRRPEPRDQRPRAADDGHAASCRRWVVGIVGVAGALSAIVPMAVFMLCIGTLWGTKIGHTARGVVVASGLAALGGALLFPDALVRLSRALLRGHRAARPAARRRPAVAADDRPGRARRPARGRGDRRPARADRPRPVPGHQRRPARPRRQRDRQRGREPGAPPFRTRPEAAFQRESLGSRTPSSIHS